MILHSAPKPDPIPTPTPRTPSSAYARCDDCGTGQGEPCYDSHDRPCAPCPGRVLADSGSLARREQVSRYKRKARAEAPRVEPVERQPREPRTYAPTKRASRAKEPSACTSCGDRVQHGGKFCQRRPCQAARQAARRDKVPQSLTRPSRQSMACWWCDAPLASANETGGGGRHLLCDLPCCGDHTCKRAIKAEYAERSRSTKPPEQEQQQHT